MAKASRLSRVRLEVTSRVEAITKDEATTLYSFDRAGNNLANTL